MSQQNIPVILLKEGTSRTRGKEAQKNNMRAAMAIAEAVRSTLGPKGSDKMLVDSLGDVVITNDGATILDEIDVEHPAAKLMIQVAKTQDDSVGDGTTSAVVLAGELLKNADALIELGIHPSIIISGYKKATEKAREILDKISMDIDIDDRKSLAKVATTALNSKVVASEKDLIAKISVDAVLQITEDRNGKKIADLDWIKVVQKTGKALKDTELINGVLLDKEVVHPGMPKSITGAKIALIDDNIEIQKTEFSAEIKIEETSQMQAFLDREEQMIEEMVETITKSGANVLVCQKGIDDLAQHFLAKKGVLAIRRVKKSDMEKMARATDGKIVSTLHDLKKSDLGAAGKVEQIKIGDDDNVLVSEAKNPRSVTILIRGGSKYITDEAERALTDSLSVVRNVVEDGKVIAGGGASEVEIALALRSLAESIGGREQLAIERFANSLEIIPKTLAENAGLDAIDIVTEIRAKHTGADGYKFGLDLFKAKVSDMEKAGILEPLRVKSQAIRSASEASELILRIDDVIAAKARPGGMPGGMPPGMPPM
ncbi:MAG: TCP-1/cpn60 chaperonin family protein [Candidatus Heimdallarchaeota archaeon]|nr:TCP-1/cpn60 chaperonin family protein [Candidatus Heimdallarchaeota archaeon]MBY8995724.1 TCP-1/cpn60 chaperonin family protein [Candidatus Heimdallarchaeota archaeon]